MTDEQQVALVDAQDAARRLGEYAGKMAQEMNKAADAFRRFAAAWSPPDLSYLERAEATDDDGA